VSQKRFPLAGYNPKRYDCEKSGCFEVMRRPQIELFADCFPGFNSPGDIDYWIERFGHILFFEWKMPKESMTRGQSLMFERITTSGRHNTVIVIWGDIRSARVDRYTIYWRGQVREYIGGLEVLKDRVFDWNAWACKNSLL
jgi:hypothetical protein